MEFSRHRPDGEATLRRKAREERAAIVAKYDLGREEGAVIDDWEDPKLEIYHAQDRFGFIHDQRQPDRGRDEKERKQLEKEMSRLDKWVIMLKSPNKWFPPGAKNRDKMVERIWKGTPIRCRGELWKILLDLETIKKEQEGKYEEMKELARKHSPDIRQIDLDVNRTYRDHTMFRERYNNRQQDLFHVLAAYSMYNSEVGYCQGMSQVAALLLMFLNEAEDAFWALSQLMVDRKYNMHGFFIPRFPRLMRFQAHYDKILLKKLRRLQKHMINAGCDSGIYTLKWFLQCFLDRMPFSLSLRVWDLYLLEGECIMFAMSYCIIKMHRKNLMKMGMDEMLELIQKNLQIDFGFDDDYVIETGLKDCLKELRDARLHTAGQPPPDELPQKPFGLLQLPTAEEEAGVRQPFSDKEREFSEHTIQRQADNVNKLQHLNSQTSIDEGSYDHSLNETGSLEPDTEDHHSDILEHDMSAESPVSTTAHTPLPPKDGHTPLPPKDGHTPLPGSVGHLPFGHTPISQGQAPYPENHQNLDNRQSMLPPSPLPPSKEQDELDKALLKLMKEADMPSISSPVPRPDFSLHAPRPASAEPGAQMRGASAGRSAPGKRLNAISAHANISAEFKDRNLDSSHRNLDSNSKSRLGSDFSVSSRGASGALNTSVDSTSSETRQSRHHLNKSQSRVSTGSTSEIRHNRSTSKGSKGSATTSTYYFGEAPDLNNDNAVNGHDEAEDDRDVVTPDVKEEILNVKEVEDVLNTSHEGEVVRIHVNYDKNKEENSNIERIQATEISPRFNGHKVTIQVNHGGSADSSGDRLVKSGPSQNSTPLKSGPSQNSTPVKTGPSQNSTPVKTGPSQNSTSVKTGPSQNSGSRFASSGQSKTSIERFVNVGASNNAEMPELNTSKNMGNKVNSAGSGERFVKGSKEKSFIPTRQKVQEVSKHHVVTTEKKVKARGEKIYKTTHTMNVSQHNSNLSPKNAPAHSASDRLDTMVSSHSSHSQFKSFQSQKMTSSSEGSVLRHEREQWQESSHGGSRLEESSRVGSRLEESSRVGSRLEESSRAGSRIEESFRGGRRLGSRGAEGREVRGSARQRETFVDNEDTRSSHDAEKSRRGTRQSKSEPLSDYNRETFF